MFADGDAELTAFGAGVGGPSRLLERDTCEYQRTVYFGAVLVIACTLERGAKKTPSDIKE